MRIDERPFRVVVQASEASEGLAFAGWELPDAAALDRAAAELDDGRMYHRQPRRPRSAPSVGCED